MPFKPGSPKPPTSGRKKGTRNKLSLTFEARMADLKIDPVKELRAIKEDPACSLELKAKIHMELLKYHYPQRKAVEHTGVAGGPIEFTHVDSIDDIRSRIARIADRRAAGGILPKPNGHAGSGTEV